jgi:hypothetical protein
VSHRVSRLVFTLLSATASALLAQSAWPADSLAQRIEACARQQDDAARLKCFDHEASVLRTEGAARASAPAAARIAPVSEKAAEGVGAAPSTGVATTSVASAAAPAGAGAAPVSAAMPSRAHAPSPAGSAATGTPPEKSAQPVTARIVSISTTPAGGALRFELDNGQVWQQNERETYLSLAAGDSVQIKAGSFRSFVLRTPSGVTTRVHQVH